MNPDNIQHEGTKDTKKRLSQEIATPPNDAGMSNVLYGAMLLLLAAAALALRLWNVDFGLPARYHPDEGGKASVVTVLLNLQVPDYVRHPGLLVNSVAIFCAILKLFGLPTDPDSIILDGRILVAIVGALTLWPTAWLGTLLFNRRAGLFSAAAVAFSPLHSVHSRYLKEDVYLVFWILMTTVGLVGWLQRRGSAEARRWLILAVVSAGLSMGSKFVGAISIGIVVLAWARSERPPAKRIVFLIAGALLVFVLTTPQLFNFAAAGHDIWDEFKYGVRAQGAPSLQIYQWPDVGTYFFFHGLGWGLSWPLTLFGITGLVMAWRQRRARPDLAWTAITLVAWYLCAEITPVKRGGDVERYVLPCVPLLGVFAAGVIAEWGPARGGGRWWAAVAVLLLALPLAHSLVIARNLQPDTRVIAAEWLAANGPREPYSLAYLGEGAYVIDGRLVPQAGMNEISINLKKQKDVDQLEKSAVFVTSSLATDRYTKFPKRSENNLKALADFRAKFPYEKRFTKPFYMKAGFHNPDIEIRFREPIAEEK